jgi:CBS domain containing-hemolysin-like protein
VPLRKRTADAVLRMLNGKHEEAELDAETSAMIADNEGDGREVFNEQERRMIERVLGMAQRTVSSVMTTRHDIEHIDLSDPQEVIIPLLENNQHTRLVVTEDASANEPLGVVHVIDLLSQQLRGEPLNIRALIRQPLVFPEQLSLLLALEQFREAHTHFAFIADEFGSVEGIITLSDIMETIAGNLPLENEDIDPRYDIKQNEDGTLVVNGYLPLEDLVGYIPVSLEERREYHTLAGLLMEHSQTIPKVGDAFTIDKYRFEILAMESHRIVKVLITPLPEPEYEV